MNERKKEGRKAEVPLLTKRKEGRKKEKKKEGRKENRKERMSE